MHARLRPFVALSAFALALVPRLARADGCSPQNHVSTCVDSDNLWVHAGSSRFVAIGSAEPVSPQQMAVGIATAVQKKPIVLRFPTAGGAGDAPAIDVQASSTFLWAYGLTKGLEIDAAVPFTLYQSGTGAAAVTQQDPSPIVRSATRDLRIGVTGNVFSFDRTGQGFGLVTRFEASVPTGDIHSFAGERGGVAVPTATAEYRRGRWTAATEIGARLRGAVDVGGARIGSQLVGALGGSFDILPHELLSVSAEAFALVGTVAQNDLVRDANGAIASIPNHHELVPAEWIATVRSSPALAGDFSVYAGAGTSLPLSDAALTSPTWRVVFGARYAPVGRDADGDGVLDRDDKCPDVPEDRDGFEDEDGCPDPDNDRDGIPDARDRCRDKAEDFDGFQDEDGCPDLDDDNDGVPDAVDKCRNEPEDKDGFQDDDGCPEADNDHDGIPDVKDRCPNGPEDFDGFKDEDGCPDPDNDLDGIPDEKDKCPNEPEDKDGFQDDDGCPDPDNDHDGILDGDDKCPNQPENIDGVQDDDGCPEPGNKIRVQLLPGNHIGAIPPLRFAAGKSTLSSENERDVRMVMQRALAEMPLDRIVVEVYGDVRGDAGERLALARADAVRGFIAKTTKLPKDVVVTVATGDPTERRKPDQSHVDVTFVPKKSASK